MNFGMEEIRVGRRLGLPSRGMPSHFLYLHPSMEVHLHGTTWLSRISLRFSEAHQRNVAYALAHWHTFCLAVGLDYQRATEDDFLAYRTAMDGHISSHTGRELGVGTIAERLSALCGYYEHGASVGWNLTFTDQIDRQKANSAGSSSDRALAMPIGKTSSRFVPNRRLCEVIRPMEPKALHALLNELSVELPDEDQSGQRDRLIAEWLAYCGLRVHEVLGNGRNKPGLQCGQLISLDTSGKEPFEHVVVTVKGKYSQKRLIAVPVWLIEKTKNYVAGERRLAVAELQENHDSVFVCGVRSNNRNRGARLSIRRFQAIFEQACLRCGLVRKDDPKSPDVRARHSPHDLRHTYAVMTYFAEVALGNPEPWKAIQAQLGHKSLITTIDAYLRFVSIHTEWRDLRRVGLRELAGL